MRRENYIHYHCRHLEGVDFETLTSKGVRGGTYRADLPSITGPIKVRDHFTVGRDIDPGLDLVFRPCLPLRRKVGRARVAPYALPRTAGVILLDRG